MTNPHVLQSHPPIFSLTDRRILYHAFLPFVYRSSSVGPIYQTRFDEWDQNCEYVSLKPAHLRHVGSERSGGGDGVIEGKSGMSGDVGGERRETGSFRLTSESPLPRSASVLQMHSDMP